jgi:hypothetical protein
LPFIFVLLPFFRSSMAFHWNFEPFTFFFKEQTGVQRKAGKGAWSDDWGARSRARLGSHASEHMFSSVLPFRSLVMTYLLQPSIKSKVFSSYSCQNFFHRMNRCNAQRSLVSWMTRRPFRSPRCWSWWWASLFVCSANPVFCADLFFRYSMTFRCNIITYKLFLE